MADEPVAKRPVHAQLHRVDCRFGNRVADLIASGRVTHQVAELVVPVALLDVGDRGDGAVQLQAVRHQGAVSSAFEYQTLLAADAGGGIENLVGVARVRSHDSRKVPVRCGCRNGGMVGALGLERFELLAEQPVLLFEPVQPFDHAI